MSTKHFIASLLSLLAVLLAGCATPAPDRRAQVANHWLAEPCPPSPATHERVYVRGAEARRLGELYESANRQQVQRISAVVNLGEYEKFREAPAGCTPQLTSMGDDPLLWGQAVVGFYTGLSNRWGSRFFPRVPFRQHGERAYEPTLLMPPATQLRYVPR